MGICRCEGELERKAAICLNCGKEINAEEKTGSFTQWVLSDASCTCQIPQPTLNTAEFPLSRYTLLRKLGEGGTGVVYFCHDNHLDKLVAVKILNGAFVKHFEQFQSEAKITAKFQHANVVSIIDFGFTEAHAPYMVLEYVEGRTLAEHIAEEGPLAESIAVDLFVQIASTLAKCHESGILHRDIKSSNIIITEKDGGFIPHIIDFGIATIADAVPNNSSGSAAVGTPKYMPPEQLQGERCDARSDIYSLGCVIFEALSGRVPFVGGNALEILHKHVSEDPPFISDVNPDFGVSDPLEALVQTCLAKEPSMRFQTMADLEAALKHCAENREIASNMGARPELMADPDAAAAPYLVRQSTHAPPLASADRMIFLPEGSAGKVAAAAALLAIILLVPAVVYLSAQHPAVKREPAKMSLRQEPVKSESEKSDLQSVLSLSKVQKVVNDDKVRKITLDDERDEARIFANKAESCKKEGDYEHAAIYFSKAAAVLRQKHNDEDMDMCIGYKRGAGDMYMRMGGKKGVEAEYEYKDGIKYAEENGLKSQIPPLKVRLAESYDALGLKKAAIREFEEAEKALAAGPIPTKRPKARDWQAIRAAGLLGLGRDYLAAKRYDEAEKALRSSRAVHVELLRSCRPDEGPKELEDCIKECDFQLQRLRMLRTTGDWHSKQTEGEH